MRTSVACFLEGMFIDMFFDRPSHLVSGASAVVVAILAQVEILAYLTAVANLASINNNATPITAARILPIGCTSTAHREEHLLPEHILPEHVLPALVVVAARREPTRDQRCGGVALV